MNKTLLGDITSKAYLRVKNWEKFQHYRDRTPPWIKLYSTLLDDHDFAGLPDRDKGALLLIWLLASRQDNHIPYDPPRGFEIASASNMCRICTD